MLVTTTSLAADLDTERAARQPRATGAGDDAVRRGALFGAALGADLRHGRARASRPTAPSSAACESPYRETTELHGENVRVEREGSKPRRFSLDRAPELRGMLASFGALLTGDRETLERHFVVAVQGDTEHWRLELSPRDERLQAPAGLDRGGWPAGSPPLPDAGRARRRRERHGAGRRGIGPSCPHRSSARRCRPGAAARAGPDRCRPPGGACCWPPGSRSLPRSGGSSNATLVVGTDLRLFLPSPRTPQERLVLEEIGEGPASRMLLLAIGGSDPEAAAETSRALVAALAQTAPSSAGWPTAKATSTRSPIACSPTATCSRRRSMGPASTSRSCAPSSRSACATWPRPPRRFSSRGCRAIRRSSC